MSAVVASCKADYRDSHCTPDEPDHATSPGCIYAGTGKGPPLPEGTCPPITGDPPAKCPTFYDVLNVLADPTKGNCSSAGCHGSEATAQDQIFLPIADPEAFYEGLLGAEGTVGAPYLIADDPATGKNEALDSWMICNLQGAHGGGFPMPPPGGMPDPNDIQFVEDWILCGAPAPVPCTAADTDSDCVVCAKDSCCPQIQQCLSDTDCEPCAACVQTTGDPMQCVPPAGNDCDMSNMLVTGLFNCVSVHCSMQCPGLGG